MQLPIAKANQLWPEKSEKIHFVMHVYNEEDCIARCIKSVLPLTDSIYVLIDDRTTDKTEEIAQSLGAKTSKFTWQHNFSYAKNLAISRAKIPFGDWILVMGADFELQPHTIPEIKEFVKDPTHFFAQFYVPEYDPDPSKTVVTRKRKLLWRHHPYIYWERLVHEETVYSAYRLTGYGIPFGGVEWKEFPILGGSNGMLHYGYHEDGTEHGPIFQAKKDYYVILKQINNILTMYNLPENEQGMKQAMTYIYNNPEVINWDLSKAITGLVERYKSGDLPLGLSYQFCSTAKLDTNPHYDWTGQ